MVRGKEGKRVLFIICSRKKNYAGCESCLKESLRNPSVPQERCVSFLQFRNTVKNSFRRFHAVRKATEMKGWFLGFRDVDLNSSTSFASTGKLEERCVSFLHFFRSDTLI